LKAKGHAGHAGRKLREKFGGDSALSQGVSEASTGGSQSRIKRKEEASADRETFGEFSKSDEKDVNGFTPVYLEEELKHMAQYTNNMEPIENTQALSLDFPPEVRNIILDIGPNVHPVTPPIDDPTTAVISIEPLPSAVEKIRGMELGPRHLCVPCAIAGSRQLATFKMYNLLGELTSFIGIASGLISQTSLTFLSMRLTGVSSSLANPAHEDEYWTRERGRYAVSVLTLEVSPPIILAS